ncbi:MAG TPA: M20 family metallopeptidase [Pyrinomonadaceae bacterium]|nr:M20 family metallopeptidase [Pyrinomonadaceae bacterium]
MNDLHDSVLTKLTAHFQQRQESILSFIREIVELESPSGYEAGSVDVAFKLGNFASTIPAFNRVKYVVSPGYGRHLRLEAFSGHETKPLVLVGHTDTVHPRGSLQERPWRVENGKAFGPGVFDMKANCVLAMEVIRALSDCGIGSSRPVTLLFTCDEETGSFDGRQLVEAEAQAAHAVLVLEPPAPGGRVKTGRKGTGMFSLQAQGIAAHAGLEPEKGASAVLELARQTEKLHALNNGGSGIRVNVGVFNGGTVSNVVPAEARAEIDVRFATAAEAAKIESEIFNLRPFDERVQLTVKGGINRPPLERSEKVLELYERARSIAGRLGFDLGETQVGGASDGNFAAAAGATVLDGLGLDGDGAHAVHEHIIIEDIPRRGALLAALIASFD